MSALDPFIYPRSIAVVGASRDPSKVGREIVANLVHGGFDGQVYPINPNATEIEGLACVPSLRELSQPPDLVIIAVPAAKAPGVMKQCAAVGARAVVVITAGFREVGPGGARLEADMLQTARTRRIRLLGPNCLGLLVPSRKLNASFGNRMPPAGNVGYLSQSGALLTAILDMACDEQLGYSALVSIGNKADIDELDVLRTFAEDSQTKVIAGFLESINDGNTFVREVEQISRRKPVLLLKAGGTAAGAAAAASHTGSQAGRDEIYEMAFDRAGVIRCDSISEQFDMARAFAKQPLPAGPNVVVVTNAGGPGVMAVDAIERRGLVVAPLTEPTHEALGDLLPPESVWQNPIDLLGDATPDRYESALRIVLADPQVHAVLVLLTPQATTQSLETAKRVAAAAAEKGEKPVLAGFLGAGAVAEARALLRDAGIPNYASPEFAVNTLKAMVDYAHWRERPMRVVRLFPVNRHRVQRVIERNQRREHTELGETESKEILEAYGFATPRGSVATDVEHAADIADQLGYPVVLKIWSPDIIHKSEVGGVRVGLTDRSQVMDAFDLMMYRIPRKKPRAQIMGVLVQEMVQSGREVVLGMERDARFGPIMHFGVGGAFVESLHDEAIYLAPLTDEEARLMLTRSRTYPLLAGRGEAGPRVDLDAMVEALQRLSQLVTETQAIQRMQISPLMVGPPGVTPLAVDAHIQLRKPAKGR